MKTINYTGSSKLISRIVHLLNRKAPLPLNGDGDAVWGTNGQVLTTDGQGNTSWTTPQGGGGDVTDVEVNGTSVVNAQGVAEVSVPTKTSDLNNDSDFIDSTDLATALGDYTPTASLATVATSGSYNDLQDKPTIPSAQVQSDWSQADNTQVDYIKNKPTIPTALADLTEDSTHRVVTDAEKTAWNAKSDFSGSYNDLTDKPTIPTVNDGTLTIQQNGTTLGTFTANQSGNTTVNLTGGGSTYTEGDGIDISAQDVISVDTTFTEASTRANIASGDTFSTILGKIKKFFTDLATVAFTGAYGDLSGTPDLTNVAYKNIDNQFSENQTIDCANGTTTTIGNSTMTLGNNIPDGTAGNSRGSFLIYGKNSYYTTFRAPNSTANRDVLLPDANGTVALKDVNNNFTASQTVDRADGTTTTAGTSGFVAGNNIPEGTAGNSMGRVSLYGKGSNYGRLQAPDVTATRTYNFPDASGTVALEKGSVSVTANGVKTFQTLLNELYALVDKTKLSPCAKWQVKEGASTYTGGMYYDTSTALLFNFTTLTADNRLQIYNVKLASTSDYTVFQIKTDGTITVTNNNSYVPGNGTVLKVCY